MRDRAKIDHNNRHERAREEEYEKAEENEKEQIHSNQACKALYQKAADASFSQSISITVTSLRREDEIRLLPFSLRNYLDLPAKATYNYGT